MKKTLIFLILVLCSIVLHSQDSIQLIGVYPYESTGFAESENEGTLLSNLNINTHTVVLKNFYDSVLYTSIYPADVFISEDDAILKFELSQKKFDQDDDFEIYFLIYDNKTNYIVYIIDNDGSYLFKENLGNTYSCITFIDDNKEYFMFISTTTSGRKIYKLNNLIPDYTHVDTNIYVHICDTVRIFVDTTYLQINSDTITYLKTEYLSTYDELIISLDDFTDVTIPKGLTSPQILIYPNPTTSSVNIDCDLGFEDYTLDLIKPNGQVAFSQKLSSNEEIKLNIEDLGLSTGIHILKFTSPGGSTISKKLLIK